MKRNQELEFLPVALAPSDLVATILEYTNLPYNEGATCANWEEGRGWVGHANCFSVFLLAARRHGLLKPKLAENLNLPPAIWGQSSVKSLWEIIDWNFNRVERPQMDAGDVLSLQYKDVDPTLNEPHHVAICTNINPNRMFHASQSVGHSYSTDIDILIEPRIKNIWRMKNFSF